MRIANLDGAAVITSVGGGFRLAEADGGSFGGDPDDAVARIPEIEAWMARARPTLDPALSMGALESQLLRLGPPVTRPRQIFAIGLNYRSHADETGMQVPDHPMIFTKFPSPLAGPGASVVLPADTVDWEVELVAVIGRGGRDIARSDALACVAGFCVGQDLSERTLQMANSPAQFSLAKSHAAFAPIGPWLTTLDELPDPLDLSIECRLGSETLQSARTSQMIFDVSYQISYLSAVCELYVGDLVFTGTPDGVGFGRTPPRYLAAGDVLISVIEGLGTLRTPCV